MLGALQITPELEQALIGETQRLFEVDRPAPAINRVQLEAQLERLGEAYADGTISKAKYTQRRDAFRAQLATVVERRHTVSHLAVNVRIDTKGIPVVCGGIQRGRAAGDAGGGIQLGLGRGQTNSGSDPQRRLPAATRNVMEI